MPRLLRKFPAYQLHKASGQACVRISGRVHYLGKHDSQASRILYDRLIAEWLARGRQPLIAPDDELTISELCARFWEFAKTHYRKAGQPTGELACYKSALRPLLDLYADASAAEFGAAALKAVRQKMVDLGWARKTCNKQCYRIRRVFRWGLSEELVPAEVVTSLESVQGLQSGRTVAHDRPDVKPVPDSDVEKTICHLPMVLIDMVMFQRFTGCRPHEVCEMRLADIDRSAEDVWQYRPRRHKTEHHNQPRVVMIGPSARGVILKYLDRSPEAYLFSPLESEIQRRGKPPKRIDRCPQDHYTPDSFRRAVQRAAQKAKVPAWSPNQLRHAAATQIRQRFGLDAAAKVLGHADCETTMIYAEADESLAKRVALEIG